MKNFFTKVNIFFWFFFRPKYTFHSLRLLNSQIKKIIKNNKKISSIETCYKNQISNTQLIKYYFNKEKLNFSNELKKYHSNFDKDEFQKMGGGSNLELIFNFCEFLKPKLVLETGVAYGWSSLAFLISLNKNNGKLISINLPYPDKKKINLIGKAVPINLINNWNLISGADKDEIPKILRSNNKIDIFHYDSDKSYEGKYWCLKKVWPKISSNGFILCDDLQDNNAFFDFVDDLKVEYKVSKYNNKYIGIVKKN